MKINPLIISLLVLVSCQTPPDAATEANLGSLHHQFSISDLASESFEHGLLLLHSFEYDDAREAFQEALEADDTEVMAYWGEAMSHYKALWGLQDIDAGRKVMSQLGATRDLRLDKAENELERDFWMGVELLYGDGELADRNIAYSEHMGKLHDKYPKNQEVAAFYALGLMWSVPVGRDADVFNKSAQVVAGILEENPNHPGALHYMIHAYDDPDYAQLAINAANLYSKVAPDATHALHMPSHIYLALGMWKEVAASNEASYEASINRIERKGLGDAARGYHSYSWLHYAYLQQERRVDANKLLKDMADYTKRSPTQQARAYWIAMINARLTSLGTWNEDITPMVVSRQDLGLTSKAGFRFFQGHMAYLSDDSAAISLQMDSLDNEIAAAELLVTSDGITLCSAGTTRYAPNRTDIQRATVMMHQLAAFKALVEKDSGSAEESMLAATSLEATTGYSFGPPEITYPSYEQYGYWLLTQDRPKDALEQFENGLERTPKRTKALRGKLMALEALGNKESAAELYQVINDIVEVSS